MSEILPGDGFRLRRASPDDAEFYAELAREFGVPYEGKIVTSVLYSAELKSDPIHPNALGYRKMAEAIAALLRTSGAL